MQIPDPTPDLLQQKLWEWVNMCEQTLQGILIVLKFETHWLS